MLQRSKYHKKHVAIFISFVVAKKYLKCERKTFILPHSDNTVYSLILNIAVTVGISQNIAKNIWQFFI